MAAQAASRSLPESIVLTEVSAGHRLLGDLFQRKFGAPAPEDPHHLLAFHRLNDGPLRVACYAHFMPFGDVCLVGGVCTDGRVIRAMAEAEREAIRRAGGLYFHLLSFGFERFRQSFAAFFGYCGDARALEVNLAAGFEPAGPEHLLIHAPEALPETHRKALIAKVHALGPF